MLGGFDDVRDGFFAGEQGEEEVVGGFSGAEKVGRQSHKLFKTDFDNPIEYLIS